MKSSKKNRVSADGSSFLITFLPILFTVAIMVVYFFLKNSRTPINIAEVTTIPACTGFIGGTVTPDNTEPEGTVVVTCDYGIADLDCIKPVAYPYDFTSCAADGYDGTKAKFNCVAPSQHSWSTVACTRISTPTCDALELNTSCRNLAANYTVESVVTPPGKPVIAPLCDGTTPIVNIAWTGTPSTEGFWVQIADNTDHEPFYQKLVPTGLSTTADGFSGYSVTNYEKPLVLDPAKTYYAWVFNGNMSPVSAPFKPKTCIASPSPSPSPTPSNTPTPLITLRHEKSTCNSLSFNWDKIANVPGYRLELSQTSDFKEVRDSGDLQNSVSAFTYGALEANKAYYVRISAIGIHDYPRFTKLLAVKTLVSCNTANPSPSPTAKPTVKPKGAVTPVATPKASPKLSPAPSATPAPSLVPTAFEDNRFENVDPNLPVDGETVKPRSPLARFLLWFFALFGK